MRRQNYCKLIVVIFILFNACEQNVKKRTNCICYIDYSGSLTEKTLDVYIHTISHDLMKNLNQYDRLTVLPIDEGAKLEPVKLINEDFKQLSLSKQSDGFTHAQDSIKKRINDYVEKRTEDIARILKAQKYNRLKFEGKTNIFGAIEQTKSLLENNEEDSFFKSLGRFFSGKNKILTENVIVLFSDMINDTEEANFAETNGPNDNEIIKIMKKLKEQEKIPNLKDIKIFINGRTGNSNLQVERVQKFWEKYFEATGAKMMAYGYDVGDDITKYLKNIIETNQ